ncbi:polysaccharide export protein [Rhodoblastus acidophilus]|uniref:Polysaccharide export protein n=1 Tax=Candidatus Rhodoblastus alkanivorans TaxID=2954117 RepID=A0ABS9Z9S2_9HYPH|nr:polysaccharide biosynthesis/export family protein [Candidatus Rhodoblastus alkanivorans]MCI4679821.1 polysaccharide export protein [Candidatus Rhodoblastus alkanivorans]MCI4684327.1 polysaccharide export protein [Candidatus Rhodoblastus alkanivorans]MDI4641648.1 polysaccharide export protein [Rhodoblastus acidophilus]
MRRFLLLACLVLSAALQGCADRRIPAEFQAYADAPYSLGPGDRLRVIVFGQDSLSNSYAVDSSGKIAMPLIGFVPATGRSPSELAREIAARLRAGYIRDPQVSVEVEAYRPFFILGEVTTAGQYPFVNGMSVETAVAIAGGYTARARKDDAQVTRTRGDRTVTVDVPVTTPVRPGDTIYIPERFF